MAESGGMLSDSQQLVAGRSNLTTHVVPELRPRTRVFQRRSLWHSLCCGCPNKTMHFRENPEEHALADCHRVGRREMLESSSCGVKSLGTSVSVLWQRRGRPTSSCATELLLPLGSLLLSLPFFAKLDLVGLAKGLELISGVLFLVLQAQRVKNQIGEPKARNPKSKGGGDAGV
jgi:hypothetical protein